MKQLILIFLFASSLAGLCSCKKDVAANSGCKKDPSTGSILINFINKTGAEIQCPTANNIQVGTIENNGETGFVNFENFRKDTGMPDCDFVGLFNNDTLYSTSRFYWCGTEKAQLQAGRYNIEVKLNTIGADKYFHLRFK
jgi:hypothetical protein